MERHSLRSSEPNGWRRAAIQRGLVAVVGAIAAAVAAPAAAERIGVASAVQNQVRGDLDGDIRTLGSGDDVNREELISTGAASGTQLVFLDRTSVTMGENAELRLNRFVYDPDVGFGEFVLRAVRGAFRFISGVASGENYLVETPRVTIGIRGSIVEGFIDPDTQYEVIVLVQGTMEICQSDLDECLDVIDPGTFVQVTPTGRVIGPQDWAGPVMNLNAGVDFARVVVEDTLDTGADPLARSEEQNEQLDGTLLEERFPELIIAPIDPNPEPEPEPGPEPEP